MHNRNILLAHRPSLMILVTNVLGALLYLWGARHAWVIPEEAANGIHSVTGEPFVWAAFVLPVWLTFLIVNFTWGLTIVMRRRWLQGRFWLTSGVVWIIAFVIDFAHH